MWVSSLETWIPGALELLNQAWEKGSMRDGDLSPSFSRTTQSAVTNLLCLFKNPPLLTFLSFEDEFNRRYFVCSGASRSIQPCCRSAPLCCASIVLPSSGMLTAAVSFFFPLESTDAPTHICVCSSWSARVSVQWTGRCRASHSHVDHNDGLLLGLFTLQAATSGLTLSSGPV